MHLIDNMGLGGAEMMLFKLLSGMDRSRFENTVISMMPLGPVGKQVASLGLPIHFLEMQKGRPTFRAFILLVRLLLRLRPDVLQTWLANADLAGLICGRLAGVPHIVWNIRGSNLLPGECSRLTRFALHACARLSRWPTLVISNSEAGRKAREDIGYHPRAWRILPNGFDLEVFKPDAAARLEVRTGLGIPLDAPLIGIVGRFHPMKDHFCFLKAAEIMHTHLPEVHFMMVGEGLTTENYELKNVAPCLSSSEKLHLLGARQDVPRLLSAMDIFSLTSHGGEGFPNVVGEAMACGVPCVVTETAGDAPVIVGETGIAVPPKTPEAFTEAWERILDMSYADRRALGDAARRRVLNNYSISAIITLYEKLYISISRQIPGLRDHSS